MPEIKTVKSSQYIVVQTAVDSSKVAKHIAKQLVRQKLVACAQVIPRLTSFYWWEEKVQCAREYLVLAKTEARLFTNVEQAIVAMHPYALPDIIAWEIAVGKQDYLDWISAAVSH